MVKRSIKKPKLRKRQKQNEISASALWLRCASGCAIGILCAFALLAVSALVMKLTASDITSCTGWVLAAKIISALLGSITAILGGGRLLWLRGLAVGGSILLLVSLIMTLFVQNNWVTMMADVGLGAAIGFAAGSIYGFFKK